MAAKDVVGHALVRSLGRHRDSRKLSNSLTHWVCQSKSPDPIPGHSLMSKQLRRACEPRRNLSDQSRRGSLPERERYADMNRASDGFPRDKNASEAALTAA
jgi:hypothetical protein